MPVKILRDTGAKHSLIRAGALPFSNQTYCGLDILVWGIKMSFVLCMPLHSVQLTPPIVFGPVQVGLWYQLPLMEGDQPDLILGNDLATESVPLPLSC